jgi:hypothetical protein
MRMHSEVCREVRGPTRESRAMLTVLEVLGYLVPATIRGLRWRDYNLSLVTDPKVMALLRVLVTLQETPALCS